MRITEDLLVEMGAGVVKIQDSDSELKHWKITISGYEFYFHNYRSDKGTWYFGLDERWNYCHSVSDIEECIGFAMEDGEHSGCQSLRKDIKELLHVFHLDGSNED